MNLLNQKITTVKKSLKENFFADNRPWVVTFSGGKDSTTVLHLVIEMLLDIKSSSNTKLKKVYIVSSDTGVEMPIIERYVQNKLQEIKKFVEKENLNVDVELLTPKVTESFWTLLLGKGYPSPSQSFRWCTDRMKIRPATECLTNLTNNNDSILMLLGVRSDESASRANSIERREENHRGFSMHPDIPNAYVYSPIKDWTNSEVWTFLTTKKAPWGIHEDMMSLYDKGSGEGDCNIALNPESPSCGKTRFGCWVCTVVEKDRSMEGMLQNGEEWMIPLWEYREVIFNYRNDLEKRDTRRRDGSKGAGPFLPKTRQELLEKLLKIEEETTSKYHEMKKDSSDYNPNEKIELIKDEEIDTIQQMWDNDGDISNRAYRIAQKFGRLMDRPITTELRDDLESFEEEYFNIDLFERIYEIEAYRKNISTRYGVLNDIEKRVIDLYKGEFRETN